MASLDWTVPVSESRRAAEALKAIGGDVRYPEVLGGIHNVWDPSSTRPCRSRSGASRNGAGAGSE